MQAGSGSAMKDRDESHHVEMRVTAKATRPADAHWEGLGEIGRVCERNVRIATGDPEGPVPVTLMV